MRTTIENKEGLQYELHLEGAKFGRNDDMEISLTRSSFYDFAAKHGAIFGDYSNEEESRFAASLF